MTLIQANGVQTPLTPRNGHQFTHVEIEQILNCNRMTALALGENLLFIDANAVRQGKEVNEYATELAKDVLYENHHFVAGHALLVPRQNAPRKKRR